MSNSRKNVIIQGLMQVLCETGKEKCKSSVICHFSV